MINVTIVDNLHRNTYPVDPNTTLRSVLEAHDVDYTTGQTKLDGSSLAAGDLDKTFADFGIAEKCYLVNIAKQDNARLILLRWCLFPHRGAAYRNSLHAAGSGQRKRGQSFQI